MIAEIFQRWRRRLERHAAQLLSNRHDAEEVVQDVFATIVANPDRYDLTKDPEVLLFRLVRNRCIDRHRKHAPRSNVAIEAEAPRRDEHGDLAEALAALPAIERDTLLLTAVDGLGYREVASILGCSLGTVAARGALDAADAAAIDTARQQDERFDREVRGYVAMSEQVRAFSAGAEPAPPDEGDDR